MHLLTLTSNKATNGQRWDSNAPLTLKSMFIYFLYVFSHFGQQCSLPLTYYPSVFLDQYTMNVFCDTLCLSWPVSSISPSFSLFPKPVLLISLQYCLLYN